MAGIKDLLEVIPLKRIFSPSLCINTVAAAVEVKIVSEPHANSSKISVFNSELKINLFIPPKVTLSPVEDLNCLNKKPITIITIDDKAESTCALSSSGVIETIEAKFAN